MNLIKLSHAIIYPASFVSCQHLLLGAWIDVVSQIMNFVKILRNRFSCSNDIY